MKPRASVGLQPRRPSAHFFKQKASSLRPVTSDSDERDLYGTEENNLRLAHIFFVVLFLHLVLVIGVCLFNYCTRAKKTLKPSVASHVASHTLCLLKERGGKRSR
jgi:hypothetical protein